MPRTANKVLSVYQAPSSGLLPIVQVHGIDSFGDIDLILEVDSTDIVELVTDSGIYAASIDRELLVGQNSVVVWVPAEGELGAVDGPWNDDGERA